LTHSLRYEDRRARENTTFYSVFRKDDELEPNRPNRPDVLRSDLGLREEALLIYEGAIGHTPFQQYLIRPDAQIPTESNWPTITADWRYGVYLSDENLNSAFFFAGLGLRKDDWRVGRLGLLTWRAKGIAQLAQDVDILALIDQTLFNGNPLQFNSIQDYPSRFLALEPYQFATDGNSFQAAIEHNFNGAIWSRLPLLNKLRWHVIVRAAMLQTDENAYQEYGVGLGNIGFGLARFIRFDLVWNNQQFSTRPQYYFGLNLPFGSDGFEISL
jgi:hypothetical protein